MAIIQGGAAFQYLSTQYSTSQVGHRIGDRRDAAERAAAEHGFREFDLKSIFQSEHDSDCGQRRQSDTIQITVFVQGLNIDGQSALSSKNFTDGGSVDGGSDDGICHDCGLQVIDRRVEIHTSSDKHSSRRERSFAKCFDFSTRAIHEVFALERADLQVDPVVVNGPKAVRVIDNR